MLTTAVLEHDGRMAFSFAFIIIQMAFSLSFIIIKKWRFLYLSSFKNGLFVAFSFLFLIILKKAITFSFLITKRVFSFPIFITI